MPENLKNHQNLSNSGSECCIQGKRLQYEILKRTEKGKRVLRDDISLTVFLFSLFKSAVESMMSLRLRFIIP